MKPILFTNRKGGVGKTTGVYNLGWLLSNRGFQVLLVDLDPQGNLSKGLLEPEQIHLGLYEALRGEEIFFTRVKENLMILTGDERLSALEKQLVGEIDGFTRLSALLQEEVFWTFDFILIDSPPSLSMLTTNGLVAAEYLVSPINPKLYALHGMNELLSVVSKVKKSFASEIEFLGIIINDFEKNPVITGEIALEIEEAFGEKVFKTKISRSIKFEEAVARKIGVVDLPKLDKSRAKEEVEAVCDEFLRRLAIPVSDFSLSHH
jgi:chromosome partitioning protein